MDKMKYMRAIYKTYCQYAHGTKEKTDEYRTGNTTITDASTKAQRTDKRK